MTRLATVTAGLGLLAGFPTRLVASSASRRCPHVVAQEGCDCFWTLIFTVVVALAGVAALRPDETEQPPPTVTGNGNAQGNQNQQGSGNQQGTANQQANGSHIEVSSDGCVAIQGECVSAGGDGTQLATAKEKLSKVVGATDPPAGAAPWEFVVLGTGNWGSTSATV